MEQKKRGRKKFDPGAPGFADPIIARIDAMTPEELWERLTRLPEGIEITNMNEMLAEYDRQKREAAERAKAG